VPCDRLLVVPPGDECGDLNGAGDSPSSHAIFDLGRLCRIGEHRIRGKRAAT
jgi:hypothetical protein